MKHTTPAVVFHLDMINSTDPHWSIAKGKDGISYIAREGKFSDKYAETFKSPFSERVNKDYTDYMDKCGLFDATYSMLSEEQKDTYRDLEKQSKSEGCPKYLGYLSFKNQFLIDNGIMVGSRIDRDKLIEVSRKGINALITTSEKLKNNNTYWYAAIHEDTDNIHVHYTVLEYHRLEDRTITYKGKGQDLIEQKAFQKMKSAVANSIITDKLTPELTAFKRNSLIPEIKQNVTASKELIDLLEKLPPKPPKSAWEYNNFKVRPFQGDINRCVDSIINSNDNLKNLYSTYIQKLNFADEQYKEFYGENSDYFEYSNNQLDDFYNRAGNKLLQELAKLQESLHSSADDMSVEEGVSKKDEIDTEISPLFDNAEQRVEEKTRSGPYMKWSDTYKNACKLIYGKKSTSDDFQKAEQLLLSEARLGNILAIHDLGKLYSTDKLGEKDLEKSQRYYSEALKGFLEVEPSSKKLKPYVQYRIGKMYGYGLGSEQDQQKAFDWFSKSAAEGNKFAQFSMANMYYYGNGVNKDLSKAYEWYQKSSLQGQPYAAYAVAKMYNNGEHVTKDKEAAQGYYKKALSGFLKLEQNNQADDNMFYKIAMMYKNGFGTESNEEKAMEYFKRSAAMNNKNGLYEYGVLQLERGNTKAAVKLIEKAIVLGNDNAKRFLAQEYILGEHLPKDITKGIALLTELSDKGDISSSYRLGKTYMQNGDIEKAVHYFEKSADKNSWSSYQLGKYYNENNEYKLAEHYLLRPVEERNVYAMYQLGKMYLKKYKESNDQKDVIKAERWLQQAADLDNPYAQCSYGMLCFKTNRRDKGLFYLEKAAAHGNEFAQTIIQTAVNRKEAELRKRNKRKFRSFVAQAAFNRSRSSAYACWSTIHRLVNDYEYHIKKLQEEFDYENNISNEISIGYEYQID